MRDDGKRADGPAFPEGGGGGSGGERGAGPVSRSEAIASAGIRSSDGLIDYLFASMEDEALGVIESKRLLARARAAEAVSSVIRHGKHLRGERRGSKAA